MRSEAKYLMIDINNKLDRIAALHQSESRVLDGKPPKITTYRIGQSIKVARNALDNVSKRLK